MPEHLSEKTDLVEAHTPSAISDRLAQANEHSYVRDFVFGAIDGTVTTFAVVAGVAGAELSAGVAVILGVANLLADGFSMAASNYLGTKAEGEVIHRVRRMEEKHIDQIPDGEREEIRQIFAGKGFEGDLLQQVVDVITTDRRRWVDTMLIEEFGLRLQTPSPLRAAAITFGAFLLAGAIPLAPLVLAGGDRNIESTFTVTCFATGITFFIIGVARGKVVHRSLIGSGIETLAIGGFAAILAFAAGKLLRALVGG